MSSSSYVRPSSYVPEKPDPTPIEKVKERLACIEKTLEETTAKLEATTTKLDSTTAKLDLTTAKLDTSVAKCNALENELKAEVVANKKEIADLKNIFFEKLLLPVTPAAASSSSSIDSVGKKLRFQKKFDQNGLMYFIGSKGNTTGYNNPADLSEVKVSASSGQGGGTLSMVVSNEAVNGYLTNNVANSWIMVDIGEHRRMTVDHYCLRHGLGYDGFVFRNWQLQGSHAGKDIWETLRAHVDDDQMSSTAHDTGDWDVTPTVGYRFFRLFQTGKNYNGYEGYLFCAGLELYGVLTTTNGSPY